MQRHTNAQISSAIYIFFFASIKARSQLGTFHNAYYNNIFTIALHLCSGISYYVLTLISYKLR
jgi:hypothetical protein